jgi:hypothetical protein
VNKLIRRGATLATGLLAGVLVGAGVVNATIPQDGVITACTAKGGGALRVIDATATSCRPGEIKLEWRVRGPAVLFANGKQDGGLLPDSVGVQSSELKDETTRPYYEITFDRDVDECAVTVTPGDTAGLAGDPAAAVVAVTVGGAIGDNKAKVQFARPWNGSDDFGTSAFHLVAVCP